MLKYVLSVYNIIVLTLQSIFYFSGCKAKSDVVFMVDTSSYIGATNFMKVRSVMIAISEKLKLYDGQSKIGMVIIIILIRLSK